MRVGEKKKTEHTKNRGATKEPLATPNVLEPTRVRFEPLAVSAGTAEDTAETTGIGDESLRWGGSCTESSSPPPPPPRAGPAELVAASENGRRGLFSAALISKRWPFALAGA